MIIPSLNRPAPPRQRDRRRRSLISDCDDDARDKLGAGIDQVVVGGLGKRTECRQVYIPIQEAVVAHLVRMDRQDLLPPFLVRKPDLHLDLKPTRPEVQEKRPWLSTCTFKNPTEPLLREPHSRQGGSTRTEPAGSSTLRSPGLLRRVATLLTVRNELG